ncbi:ATP-binding cassette domain-containing protein, partial [Mesorhizobium sp. M7A.F.Ca.CA.001.07.2.1]|uniref:ATP-binding cassette domain-containing protein n=1 Tax=Mesorhizobium sp. M7A.F.Ca.CA.001.07.2.1 TaxID=2496684 RepID=UPI000FD5075B
MTAASLTAARSFVATPVRPIGSVEGQRAFAFRQAGKRFGDKTVLDGIDLDVPAGQFLAVIGKSGCGKSTLLRLLAGLDRPTSGSLTFGVEEEGHSRTRFMFQEPRLLPWASVVKNVEVGLTGIASGAEARQRALDILGEVGLADRADEWPSVLSGGQKQRL